MLWFVLFCFAVFAFCFGLLVLRAVKVRDSYTGKVRFNFAGVHKILLSKFNRSFRFRNLGKAGRGRCVVGRIPFL
jgi:hypothetical protein